MFTLLLKIPFNGVFIFLYQKYKWGLLSKKKINKINVVFYLLNNLKKNFSPIHLGDSS